MKLKIYAETPFAFVTSEETIDFDELDIDPDVLADPAARVRIFDQIAEEWFWNEGYNYSWDVVDDDDAA